MTVAYLGLGSNIGNRERYLECAVRAISELQPSKTLKTSSIYETEPWGNRSQQPFLNQVIQVDTTLSPEKFFEECQAIEKRLGRERGERWGPRTMDIDILLFGEEIVDNDILQIPHPRLADRRFVLEPLNEVAPDVKVPGSRKRVAELLQSCPDTGRVHKFRQAEDDAWRNPA